jgi:outer membrane protein TolC
MRYSAGEGEQEAQIKAQLGLSRLLERMSDIAAERAGIVAGLNRLLGRTGNNPVGKVTVLPLVDLKYEDTENLEALALSNSPAVLMQKYAVQAAQYRLESAGLDLRPDFFAGVGMGLDANDDPMAMASFGLTIPAWQKTKQKPLQRAAGYQLETAKNDLREAEIGVISELAGLMAKWRRDQEQIRRYRDAIIPQTSEALSSARASYMAGRADFSSVIEDYNLWLDARTQLARRESDRFKTWAEVEALVAPFP